MDDRITAGELRAMGIPISPHVPDCGHISRSAIDLKMNPNGKTSATDDGVLTTPLLMQITEPFQWVEATITATKADPS